MATTKLMTAEDLIQFEDDFHYELIEGELIRMSPATPEHGWLGARFGRHIGVHADTHQLGEVFDASVGYFFSHDPDTLLEPDVSFIRADRLPPRDAWRAFFEVVPDLVVEIISPSETRAHIARKIAIYLAAGVRLVWFVDPQRRTVTVQTSDSAPKVWNEDDELDGGDVLPGFRLPLGDLFRMPPPSS